MRRSAERRRRACGMACLTVSQFVADDAGMALTPCHDHLRIAFQKRVEFPPCFPIRNLPMPHLRFRSDPSPAIAAPYRSPAMAALYDIGGVGPKRDRAIRHGGGDPVHRIQHGKNFETVVGYARCAARRSISLTIALIDNECPATRVRSNVKRAVRMDVVAAVHNDVIALLCALIEPFLSSAPGPWRCSSVVRHRSPDLNLAASCQELQRASTHAVFSPEPSQFRTWTSLSIFNASANRQAAGRNEGPDHESARRMGIATAQSPANPSVNHRD